MKAFDALLVVPLNGGTREEHVCHFSKSQSGVRLQELNARWSNVGVPFCKVCMDQYKQIYDI